MPTAKKTAGDEFANIAYLAVTEAAANTITFNELALSTNLMERKFALVIHRAEFFLTVAAQKLLLDEDDVINVALTLTNTLTALNVLDRPELLFNHMYGLGRYGVAASGFQRDRPTTRDFSKLPGGGLLVPGDRLYIAIQGTSLASAAAAVMRLYYTVRDLDVSQYWELVEARRIMTTS